MSGTKPVVIITGGSKGLGLALAEALLGKGFAVSICARSADQIQSAVQNLESFGTVIGRVGDVADPTFPTRFIQDTVAAFGRIDAVVNNASILGDLPLPGLADASNENFHAVFEVNTFAPIRILQEALPYLLAQPSSVAVSVSSDAAVAGYPNWGVYGASKAALDLLQKTIASEYNDAGLLAYLVDPGDMATDMHEAAIPGDTGLSDPRDVAKALIPLFLPLIGGSAEQFPNGSRLQVRGGVVRDPAQTVREGA